MRTETEARYYHINRVVAWSSFPKISVGSVIDVGGVSNPYFAFFENYKKAYPVNQPDGTVIEVPGAHFLRAANTGEINSPELPKIATDFAQHTVTFLRELIWEDVRRREFPHLPSRQRCIWLISTIEGVRYWLGRMGNPEDFQVIEATVQGRLHVASESHLLGEAEPLTVAIQMARQYWLGVVDNLNTQEIIFEGRVKVEAIVNKDEYA